MIVSGGRVPTGSGGRFPELLTVTANESIALRPPGSVAVTWIVAVPKPTAVSVTVLPPVNAAVTTFGGEDDTL